MCLFVIYLYCVLSDKPGGATDRRVRAGVGPTHVSRQVSPSLRWVKIKCPKMISTGIFTGIFAPFKHLCQEIEKWPPGCCRKYWNERTIETYICHSIKHVFFNTIHLRVRMHFRESMQQVFLKCILVSKIQSEMRKE